MTQVSITITGPRPGTPEHDRAFEMAASAINISLIEFESRVVQRMPVTLEPMDADSATQRFHALIDLGVECSLNEDDGRRYLCKSRDRLFGPVSAGWLRRAVQGGSVGLDARIHSVGGEAPEVSAAEWASGNGLNIEITGVTGASEENQRESKPSMAEYNANTNDAITTRMPVDADQPDLYAGFWRRVLAYFIDFLVVFAIGFCFGFVFGVLAAESSFSIRSGGAQLFLRISGVVAAWLYFAAMESSNGMATLGKRAVGLRVVGSRGERISFWRASGRWLGTALAAMTFGVGFLACIWTRRRQAIQDAVTNTFVVRAAGLDDLRANPVPTNQVEELSVLGVVGIVLACVFGFIFVIGVLAAISIPAYQDYVIRSQVAEGMRLADGAKKAMVEFRNDTGRWPSTNASAGLASASSIEGYYVAGINFGIKKGQMQITYGNRANSAISGDVLTLSAYTRKGSVVWRCGEIADTTVPNKYLPSSCR